VNIGTRQQGRLRAENVIDVDHNVDAITRAIDKALNNKQFLKVVKNITNPYGDGKSAQSIVDILETIPLNQDLIQKRITYEI